MSDYAPCALAYLCGEFPVNRTNTLSNRSICQVVTSTSLRPMSVPIFGPYPNPTDHLFESHVPPFRPGAARSCQFITLIAMSFLTDSTSRRVLTSILRPRPSAYFFAFVTSSIMALGRSLFKISATARSPKTKAIRK